MAIPNKYLTFEYKKGVDSAKSDYNDFKRILQRLRKEKNKTSKSEDVYALNIMGKTILHNIKYLKTIRDDNKRSINRRSNAAGYVSQANTYVQSINNILRKL